MAETGERVRYSVTIPLYNERESIAPLCERLQAALEPLGQPWECVLVDDGSSDDTAQMVRAVVQLRIERDHSAVGVLQFAVQAR